MHILPAPWPEALRLNGKIDFSLAPSGWERGGVESFPVPAIWRSGPRFPTGLTDIPFAPAVRFFEGELALLSAPCVALVGSRKATQRGLEMARRLAKHVSRGGGVVVSGGAHGIDEAAHRAAEGRTIMVLGQGLRAPRTHRLDRLIGQVLGSGGLILSEFRPEHHGTRFTFPQRNRVISGLSTCTVVVEASARSGALITARHALEQGRDVWVVPDHPLASTGQGNLRLLAQGAMPLCSAHGWAESIQLRPDVARHAHHPLLDHIGEGQPTVGELLDRLDLPLHALLAQLMELSDQGAILRLAGDRVART